MINPLMWPGTHVLCSLAKATKLSMTSAMDAELQAQIGPTTGLFAQTHSDATPMFVHFGLLQPYLMESARYLVQDGDKWVCVSYDDYINVRGKCAPTAAGVVEILAVNATMHWDSEHSRDIFIEPLICKHTNASTTLRPHHGAMNHNPNRFSN